MDGDGGGGGDDYDGRAHDGRPEDVVGRIVVRQPDKPHDRLVVVDVVHGQAAVRGRHARDAGVHRLRQLGAVQSVAGAVQQTDGHDEDVRRDRHGPATPILPLAAAPAVTIAPGNRWYRLAVADTTCAGLQGCSTGTRTARTRTTTAAARRRADDTRISREKNERRRRRCVGYA